MSRLGRAESGMHIVGQGAWIMLVAGPAVAAALVAQLWAPGLVRIRLAPNLLLPPGLTLVALGLALWLSGIYQLLTEFPKGRLITSGAYAVCRNPIYASMALLILPGVSFCTGTWGYLAAGAVLCLAVRIFIGREERDLARVYGDEFRRYAERVHWIIPFARPPGALG